MIYSLTGNIVEVTTDTVAIEVGNIAYEVFVSRPYEYPRGEQVKLYTYEVIGQDDHYLVGFPSRQEKGAFLSLCSVKGIGPKTAISALSKTTPNDLFLAIESSNVSYLKKLPGIGPKAASQIILDLKGKLLVQEKGKAQKSAVYEEVKAALKTLGFKAKEIDDALDSINEPSIDRDTLLRLALRKLRSH